MSCNGWRTQHLKSDRVVICDQGLPQFVVAEGHNIWKVTERQFVTKGYHRLLWLKDTAFEKSQRLWLLQKMNCSCVAFSRDLGRSVQECGKRHGIITINSLIIKFQNKFWTAKGCPGFVVEFNRYSINVDDPMSLTSLLHGALNFLCKIVVDIVGVRCRKLLGVKLHKRSWVAVGYPVMFEWSFAEQRTT